MNNLKPMICPCCGAPLHSHVCEYCGVEFEEYEKKEENEVYPTIEEYTNEDGLLERKYSFSGIGQIVLENSEHEMIWRRGD